MNPALAVRSDAPSLHVVRYAHDVEVMRGGDGRTIYGILVPWDAPTRVYDALGPTGRLAAYDEAVARGTFPEAIADPRSVKLLGHHNKSVNPLGLGQAMRNDAAGLYGELRVSKTNAGDEALELVRDGALDAFSVGFIPLASRLDGDVYVRTHGLLRETSLVTFGAYAGAQVAGVRAAEIPTNGSDPGPGVGEPTAEVGSGDQQEQTQRYGMTPNERARVLHLLAQEGY